MAASLEDVIAQMRQVGIDVPPRVDLSKAFDAFVRWRPSCERSTKKSAWARLFEYRSSASGKTYITGTFGWRGEQWDVQATSSDWTPAERAEWLEQRKAAERASREARGRDAEAAAEKARRMWDKGREFRPGGALHAYLERKRVDAFGVRRGFNDRLLVPLRDPQGNLHGLQYIAPDGSKVFGTGTAKEGRSHLIGDIRPDAPLAFGEGYATCASAHMATSWPVVVCFDAGNLSPVMGAWRKLYPDLPFVVLADDDRHILPRLSERLSKHGITCSPAELREGLQREWQIPDGPHVVLAAGWRRDGSKVMRVEGTLRVDGVEQRLVLENAGVSKAHAAARKHSAWVLMPVFADRDSPYTDYNDLHCSAGLESVREQLLSGLQDPPPAAAAKDSAPGAAASRLAPSVQPAASTALAARVDPRTGVFGEFSVDDAGVWFAERDSDGGLKKPQFVCAPAWVRAVTSDSDGQFYGLQMEFQDRRGGLQTWIMPMRMLAGDGADLCGILLDRGLYIAPSKKARERLMHYLHTARPGELARSTEKIGWHDESFVLHRETLQPDARPGESIERVIFATDALAENPLRVRGSHDGWRRGVAALCVGNSRLLLGVSMAFGAPLLDLAGVQSGIVNIEGTSSTGKSTVSTVAASVMGGPDYVVRWRATSNALESVAAQHSDLLLVLDELSMADIKTLGETVYMLCNESGKLRSSRTGQARPRLTWRVLVLSNGEAGVATLMGEAGQRTRAGQEIRMVGIPAEVSSGSVFETKHDFETASDFVTHLARECANHYGNAGRAWLAWLVNHRATVQTRLREGIDELMRLWVPEAASGQVHRVAKRFALIAMAGELASEIGITGWAKGEAVRGVRTCFQDWLGARTGGIGNSESAQMVQQVRKWLMTNQDARLTAWERDHKSERSPRTVYEAGFRKDVSDAISGEVVGRDFYVQLDVFRDEVCKGFDHRAICRLGIEAGWLKPGTGGAYDRRERLPVLGMTRCYRISSSIFDDGED